MNLALRYTLANPGRRTKKMAPQVRRHPLHPPPLRGQARRPPSPRRPPSLPAQLTRQARRPPPRNPTRQRTPPAATPQTARSPAEVERQPAAVKRAARVKGAAGPGRPKEAAVAKPRPGRITREERITTQRRTTKQTRAPMKAGVPMKAGKRIQTPEEALKAVLVRDEDLTVLSLRVADSTLAT